jgi:hypothetical protein
MTAEETAAKLDVALAHAWMVRTFLKHAEEIQEDEDFLNVPRTIFDYVRAVAAARDKGDVRGYLHEAKSKLYRLRKVADFLTAEYRRVSDHTNYQMAAVSLTGCVREIERLLAAME